MPQQSRPRNGKLKLNPILVPVDFSEESRQALDYAVALAADTESKIILLHVVQPVYVADPTLTYLPQQMAWQEEVDGKRLQRIAAKSIPKQLFDRAIIRLGVPHHEITRAAKRMKAGLIVIATHGRTGLRHVLMGSTTERVVRHAPCPVLTVRRTD